MNYSQQISLTENEEAVLFLLLYHYSQQEIAQVLKCSRSEVVKIIAENLCIKFDLPILSTKLLITKAMSQGYAMVIPEKLLPSR